MSGSDHDGKPHEDGRVRRARDRRAATRKQIVSEARVLFVRVGYDAVPLAHIADAAGITRATFYQHFDGKADVFSAVVDDLLEQLGSVVVGVDLSPDAPSPQQQLAANLLRVLDVLLGDPDYARLLLVEAVGNDRMIEGRAEAFFRFVLDMIRDALDEGQAAGLVRRVEIDIAAWSLLGAIKEVMLRSLTTQRATIDAQERQRIASELLACCLCGVGTPAVREALLGQ